METRPGDAVPGDYAESRTIPIPDDPLAQTPELAALHPNPEWWLALPAGSRLVGLVVSRPDMPSIVAQREALATFGVPIEGFRHPAPEIGETWEERLTRLFGRLGAGDVLVVTDVKALGRDAHEETRTVAELRRRSVIVKVLDRS
ncbi:dehydrogenase [Microbacterium sp. EYE_5]|nr:dehydrogenase [Microbacterium sp. EYE_382]MCK6085020.1 dehydrogenase [Microbacterium sp. EYE_384]MCK6122754.1 dehydrogenase [Microbacterium sp. EYE_80]MCK6125783.1 dehydrogenase [Microbacterium sp. EYE_79]MCK6140704.1 dehydrogenase [Microbacterium sp. EYE_39]MCK6217430.1 dehydrogenase [Microbacterium sp. EYE_5]MCK6227085.1 dehydrogenase [Microbacterium sp. EYE_77]MCK6246169.1 dehydrogenase [Microbacterium sp. EYE_78]